MKDVAGIVVGTVVGVTEPTGVDITVDESADAAESNEFIDIVDLKEGGGEDMGNSSTA